jgi:hypothetical protein
VGYLLVVATGVFVGRVVYEQTLLTWINGPQMVGFAMTHGAFPLVLATGIFGMLGGSLWFIASIVMLVWKRFKVPFADWLPIILPSGLMALLSVPYEPMDEILWFRQPHKVGSAR